MPERFHKPTKVPGYVFEAFQGADDPAESTRLAHETADAILSRVRADPRPEIVDRLVAFTGEHGIDAVAELWAHALPRTLPGALWRIYLLHAVVEHDADEASFAYRRGVEATPGIDPLVAGAEIPTGPAEISALTERILRGLFDGDFAVALDRAAAFCRVGAAGCASIADDLDETEPERSTALTRRALRYSTIAGDLTASATLWREGALE